MAAQHGKDSVAADDPALMRELRLQRNLKFVVAGLGVLIFLGLGAIGWKMMQLGKERRAGAADPVVTSTPAGAPGDVTLELPKGAAIVSTSISGNRLAVHYSAPAGTGIAVIDLDTGKRLTDVKVRDAVPKE